jgi:hypothetical protein
MGIPELPPEPPAPPPPPSGPAITVSPNPLVFSELLVGDDETKTVTITNSGTDDLIISAIDISGTGFGFASTAISDLASLPNTPITIEPDDTYTLTVEFIPDELGDHDGKITVTHNAAGESTEIKLSGKGR